MTRTRKILGPRPDPRPEIPAAGYVLEKNGLSSATDCLDHGNRDPYRKTTLEAPMANLPGKLPLNITELTPKARNMTHGVKPIVGPPAAEVVFPKPLHPLLEERERRREKNYHRREHKVLGRSLPTGSKLPAFTAHPDFRFGMSTIEEETAKEIMYPVEIPEEDESVRRQYVISHWSFAPGQRRNHYGPNFIVPERKLESGRIYNDNDGNRAKETLYWTEERAKELQTFVVTNAYPIGKKNVDLKLGKSMTQFTIQLNTFPLTTFLESVSHQTTTA
ncbi:hypothetical protein BC829DRAFT_117318 [Chytridium lagenaria]|nr:hypothetical protein BC829DRAFT_117318 [Chytridium lagenaria]